MGVSSDADSKLLKAMRLVSQIGIKSSPKSQNFKWFQMPLDGEECSIVQDQMHIGTKLWTRFIKPSIVLPLGNYFIKCSHLEELIDNFEKDVHMLNKNDIRPVDKMNVKAAEKICSSKVLDVLESVPDSAGTNLFLKNMNLILTSYLSETLTTDERLQYLERRIFL